MIIYDDKGEPVDTDVMDRLTKLAFEDLIDKRRAAPDPYIAVNAKQGWEMLAQSVLIHAGAAIGDALLCTPLIRKLARMGIDVDIVTKERSSAVFEHNRNIRNLWLETAPTDAVQDVVIDLLGAATFAELYRGGMAEGYARASHLSLCGDAKLDYTVTDDEKREALNVLGGVSSPRCAYVWSAVGSARSWSAVQHAKALDLLALAGVQVIVLNAEAVDAGSVALNLSGRTSIREAAAIIDAVDFVVAPDTGLFHIAAALDKPVIAYFGSFPLADRQTHAKVYPIGRGGCEYQPCRIAICAQSVRGPHAPCLDIDEDRLMATLEAVLR